MAGLIGKHNQFRTKPETNQNTGKNKLHQEQELVIGGYTEPAIKREFCRRSPRADVAFFQRNIPVVIGADTVLEVVLHQSPRLATISPVIGTIAALLLGLVKRKIRVTPMDTGNSPLAGPLKSCALDVVAGLWV